MVRDDNHVPFLDCPHSTSLFRHMYIKRMFYFVITSSGVHLSATVKCGERNMPKRREIACRHWRGEQRLHNNSCTQRFCATMQNYKLMTKQLRVTALS